MKVLLKEVAFDEDRSYRVTLDNGDGDSRSFVLRVEEANGILHVTWQDDFAAYFAQGLSHLSSLFETVLAFDRARETMRTGGK
jgi:hypothetical protein